MISLGTNYVHLVAELFYFATKEISGFIFVVIIKLMSLKHLTQLLDDLLNTDNPYFEGMVNQIYPPELQLNKNNALDTESPFLVLYLSIFNGFVSSKFMINVTSLILV